MERIKTGQKGEVSYEGNKNCFTNPDDVKEFVEQPENVNLILI